MNYSLLLKDPLSLVSVTLLFLTIISLWIKKHPVIWGGGMLLFAVLGLLAERVKIISIAYFILFAAVFY